MSEGYNGYTNYQTWNVVLWIFNEESHYRYWMKRREACGNLTEELELWVEDHAPVVTGLYADLLNYSIAIVDWHEVAKAIREA